MQYAQKVQKRGANRINQVNKWPIISRLFFIELRANKEKILFFPNFSQKGRGSIGRAGRDPGQTKGEAPK